MDGKRFVDAAGRQIILHGINTGGNNKTDPRTWHEASVYARMADWGLNVVRLQLDWSELEPKCGQYNEDYLQQIDQQIALAKANGIYVYLDMHQDLWGVKAIDGAPEWATLDEGLPHVQNPDFWQESYWTSPMVQKAFDNFYANKPGPDGVGIQDRFALAWRCVAKRYADEPAVIGYDLLNEPYPGSPMKMAPLLIIARMAKVLSARGELGDVPQLMKDWQDTKKRGRMMAKLNDTSVLKEFLAALEPLFRNYERDALAPLYRRVAKAIRQVDKNHILLLEPSGGAIIGVRSHLEAIVDENGRRDPFQALVPHAYGLPFGNPTTEHMGEILSRIAELSMRLDMPVILGEWDADVGKDKEQERREMALFLVSQVEKHRIGDTFWLFKPDLEQKLLFDAIRRPFPSAVAGEITNYGWNLKDHAFRCSWKESANAKQPSRFYVPKGRNSQSFQVQLTPPATKYHFKKCGSGEAGMLVIVDQLGRSVERELVVSPAK